MSVFTSVEIFIFSIFIMAFLQLVPGVFALFYHSLAGKFSKRRAEHTALFFILGVETSLVVTILLLYTILNSSHFVLDFFQSKIFSWLAAGILIALGILFCTLYFRRGPGSKLFLSRKFTRKYTAKIHSVKTRSDAFLLGFTSIIPEFIFTLPLLLLSTLAIIQLGPRCLTRAGLILLFVLLTILPLLILYTFFSRDNTLVDFLKFRFKNKSFIRFLLTCIFFLMAVLIILGVTL